MQLKYFTLKLLTLLLLLTTNNAYADFVVEPLRVKITLGRNSSALLNVINKDSKNNFVLELREAGSKVVSNDLLFGPNSFKLESRAKQVIRIATRPGVSYKGKNYILYIQTGDDSHTGGETNRLKVPIDIFGEDDFEKGNNGPGPQDNDNDAVRNTKGLTQIRISVPVTAIVEGPDR
jgi:hypothetical protein